MTCCIVRLRTQLLLFIFPSVCVCVCVCVCVFSSKIFAQPYKIKKVCLVYTIKMTSCIVESKTGFVLFVLCICSFFFLSTHSTLIFCKRFMSNARGRRCIYLAYEVTINCCIMGLTRLLLFVLCRTCYFFFLSTFAKNIFTTIKDRQFVFGIQIVSRD